MQHLDRRTALRALLAGAALPSLAGGAFAQLAPNPLSASPQTAPGVADGAGGRFKRPKHDAPLPGGKLARGTRNIAAAWFSGPTTRYHHFSLGAQHEAETLIVSTSDRRAYRLVLPNDSVFEDREPRIADVDGDGQDEVIVVRSYLKQGAALAIAAVRNNELKIIAETPPIGQPFRWLNPAGVGDFDGDGKPDVALVRMPHLEGELEIWTLRGTTLTKRYEIDDVSNHVAGSPHLKLYAVGDFNGDGVADLAIPSFDRRSLRFLTAKGGKLREYARVILDGPAAEDFKTTVRDGKPAVVVGYAGGRTTVVAP